MNEKSCASSDRATCWGEINFTVAYTHVKKLQRRIYTACRQEDIGKLTTLTHLMIHSFYAKALAVKYVCSNKGSKTPGIDNSKWISDSQKYDAICTLNRRCFRPKSLKRVYIMKSNGRKRPLGIPTIKDRAMQTLYRFALEPIAECLADDHSYGFRPKRNVNDAIMQIANSLTENPSREWILEADLVSCFDSIDHDWLLENIPMDRTILRKFLKAGYVERGVWYPTDKGTPQGGCISTILCNLTLDGLEAMIAEKISVDVDVVRYADDFIVAADDRAVLVQEVVPVVKQFLAERGLVLSQEKTSITNIKSGIIFLGWNIFKQNSMIITMPSRRAVNTLLEKIANTLLENSLSTKELLNRLKSVIRGWLNFYKASTPPSLAEVEFEALMLTYRLTGNRYLADFIGQEFAQFQRNFC